MKILLSAMRSLGVVPTREEDVVKEIGGVTDAVYENLENDNIVLMPSNAAVSQIWTPTQTFFADITKDVFRSESDKNIKQMKILNKG